MEVPAQKRQVISLDDVELARQDFLNGTDTKRELGCISKERFTFPLRKEFIFGNSYMLYGLQNDPAKEEVVAIDNLFFFSMGTKQNVRKTYCFC